MNNLSELYEQLDHLSNEELDQIQEHINQRRYRPQIDEDVQTKIAILHQAFADIREGFSKEELDELVEAMNSEYIEPLDPADYAWMDDDEENNE